MTALMILRKHETCQGFRPRTKPILRQLAQATCSTVRQDDYTAMWWASTAVKLLEITEFPGHMPCISIDPDSRVNSNTPAVPTQCYRVLPLLRAIASCFAANRRLKSGLKHGSDRPARHGRPHVNASELGRECLSHSLAAFFKKLGADRECLDARVNRHPMRPCVPVRGQAE